MLNTSTTMPKTVEECHEWGRNAFDSQLSMREDCDIYRLKVRGLKAGRKTNWNIQVKLSRTDPKSWEAQFIGATQDAFKFTQTLDEVY